ERVDAHAAAARRDRARLGLGEAGGAGDTDLDVVESAAREDCDAVPLRLAVARNGVAPRRQLLAEQRVESVVGELRLLQADDVGLALVEPRQQARHPLLDRVDVPRRDAHARTVAPARVSRARLAAAGC